MNDIELSQCNDPRFEYRTLVLSSRPDHLQKITDAAFALKNEVVAVTTALQGVEFLYTREHIDVVVADVFSHDGCVFDF